MPPAKRLAATGAMGTGLQEGLVQRNSINADIGETSQAEAQDDDKDLIKDVHGSISICAPDASPGVEMCAVEADMPHVVSGINIRPYIGTFVAASE